MDVARALGIRTDYVPLPPDRLGDYTPARDHIRLGDHDPMTFWHELAHAVHTRITEDISTVSQARRETIAELTAAVIAEMYGLDYSGNCWRYIEAYNAQDPLAAIAKALGDIEKILSVIENATGGGSHETA
jgi:antirestriction protein ArdC